MDTSKLVSAAVASSGAVIIAFHSAWTIFWIALGPTILWLSSLSVGLTDFPTTKSFVDRCLRVLGFISAHAHRNSPGTYKLPFTPTKPPDVVGTSIPLSPSPL